MTTKHVSLVSIFAFTSIIANASFSRTVTGEGSARGQENAEYRAKIDAQKKCLDLVGNSDVIQLEAFAIDFVYLDNTWLFYVTASAPFACSL